MLIAQRFCGPPRSGNGGYTAGLLAQDLGICEPVTVTLRRPPPLETELTIARGQLYDDEGRLIAEAETTETGNSQLVLGAPPEAVEPSVAQAASEHYQGAKDHPFPTCFVCGPQRAVGDGLRLFPGRLPHQPQTVATVWKAAEVSVPIVWAALDCPGAWALDVADGRPVVLGRITAAITQLPAEGETCIIVGKQRWSKGRKSVSATALYTAAGTLLAQAETVWFSVNPESFGAN